MARGRKPKIKESPMVQEIIAKVVEKEPEEAPVILPVKKEGEWDFKIGEPIEFFDSRMSYELTGYKPIDDVNGLDFDPEWFMQSRRIKEATGKYCDFKFGTKPYNNFWEEEYRRCRDGYTVNGYTLTGDNYFFINYYRLPNLASAEKAGGGRSIDFPEFYVKQYEYFHYIELCKRLRMNAIGLKSRGVGFSEIGAAIAVNTYSVRPHSRSVVAAQQSNYVEPTLAKCWTQLNFLDEETENGFKKLRQKKDSTLHKRASSITTEGTETGWMSEIEGIVADKPNKIRGDRTDYLVYEESGSWPNWKKAFAQGDALIYIQGRRFGIKCAWGTGGDSGPALEGLSDAYYNPHKYDALPYRHNYTATGETVITAYFIPAYTIVNQPGLVDHRGWTDPEKGKAFYQKTRDAKAGDPRDLLIYCAEFCFTAEEALALEGDNMFNKVLLSDQMASIRLYKNGPHVDVGTLEYKFRENKHTEDNVEGVRFVANNKGKVLIIEHPIRDEDGNVPKNLYVAGIDGIDLGQEDTSENTKDPSNFCVVVKKRTYGLSEPTYVCVYKDRPQTLEEAHRTCYKILQYYNCQAVLESTRMTTLQYFRKMKAENKYLMRRPRATQTDIQGGRSKQFGAPATETVIRHQLELIAQYVEDYSQDIWFEDMLDELMRYSYENKRHFDIVAAMGMAELGDEELMGIVPKSLEDNNKKLPPFGYWTDERGIKHKGIIPEEYRRKPTLPAYKLTYNDYQGPRTSDPRLI